MRAESREQGNGCRWKVAEPKAGEVNQGAGLQMLLWTEDSASIGLGCFDHEGCLAGQGQQVLVACYK